MKKILVVDDEAGVRKLVSSYLKQEGFEVTEAADGAAALSLARRQRPDLVVLDLMLPEIDGLEVCRILRNESDAFVIMLTAKAEETDKLVGLGVLAVVIVATIGAAGWFANSQASVGGWIHQTYHDSTTVRQTPVGAARLLDVGSSVRWRLWQEAVSN